MRKGVIIAGLIFISVTVLCHYISFYIYLHPSEEVSVEFQGETLDGYVHTKEDLEVASFLFDAGLFPLIVGLIIIGTGLFLKEKQPPVSERIEEPAHKSIEEIIREQDPDIKKKKCKQCWGSGKCNVCEGTGAIVSGVSKKEPCNVCKGSGQCPECSGYGGDEK